MEMVVIFQREATASVKALRQVGKEVAHFRKRGKSVWSGLGVWEEVTRRAEGEEVGGSRIMQGRYKDPGLHAKRSGTPAKDCKGRSTTVSLHFNTITFTMVETRLGKVRKEAGRLVERPL